MPADFEVARSVRVIGAKQLERLARSLASHSDGKELRKLLLRNIRVEALPLRGEIRGNLAARLPHRGGLAADEARAQVGLRTRTAGRGVGVRLRVANPGHDIKRLNRGFVRHPLFGDRRHWFTQAVPKRLVSEPVEARRLGIRRGVQRAMNDIAKQITDSPHRG